MYTVVAHGADPYLELDVPAHFSNHGDALRYAIDVAIVFHAAQGAPTDLQSRGLTDRCNGPSKGFWLLENSASLDAPRLAARTDLWLISRSWGWLKAARLEMERLHNKETERMQ